MSAVQYLLDRFRADADALRQRAAALRATPPQPGPDAATSLRMAEACDDVVAIVGAVPDADDGGVLIASLTALIPLAGAARGRRFQRAPGAGRVRGSGHAHPRDRRRRGTGREWETRTCETDEAVDEEDEA